MGSEKQLPIRTLTIFLVKTGVSETDLVVGTGLKRTTIEVSKDCDGTLFTRSARRRQPTWVSFFGSSIDSQKLGLWSASTAAALLLTIKRRVFAITFGYGRYFLNRSHVEDSFGLRVTLNSVEDGGIRSIDRKTFEGVTTHVREQASKEGSFSDFGLNVERDLLRAVVGVPDPGLGLGLRLAGMDALSASCRVDLPSLPRLLEKLLKKSRELAYRRKHPWIDNIAEVREPSVVQKLNDQLVRELQTGQLDRKWLAVPDAIEWNRISGFRYGSAVSKDLHHDIHLSSYLAQVRDSCKLTLEALKRHRVVAFSSESDAEVDHWSTFNCVYAEIEDPDGTFLLNNGNWYRIDADFVSKINRAISSIPTTSAAVIAAQPKETEANYNRRLTKALVGSCLMDRKNVPYGGGGSSVEFCDVLTSGRHLIHVKRYSGSAVLSHLFAQGAVSGTLFVSDAEFRKNLNAKLPKAHRLKNTANRPAARNWEVAYVVVSQSKRALRLPFFSRVTLRNAVRQLEPLGYSVTLTKVGLSGTS